LHMKTKIVLIIAIIFVITFVMMGCLPGDGKRTEEKPGNFLTGIWHGWVAPISVIVGIFNKNIRVYEAQNTGWWYDFGFYMAIISGFGGLSLARRKKHKIKNQD